MRPNHFVFTFIVILAATAFSKQTRDETVSDRLVPTGRLIQPAGETFEAYGRPVDIELFKDGKFLVAKCHKSLWLMDANSLERVQELPIPGGASLYGLETVADRVYVTSVKDKLHVYELKKKDEDSKASLKKVSSIEMPTGSFPCGVKIHAETMKAYVACSKLNQVAVVDLNSETVVDRIETGIAPFDLDLSADGSRLVVTNSGGRRAGEGDRTATSGGTDTVVDERGIANNGTVSVIDVAANKVIKELVVGLHPTTLMAGPNDSTFSVCNSNEDSISQLDVTNGKVTTYNIKPDENLPFGSMPSAICTSADGKLVFVALAGNNAIRVQDLQGQMLGLIPTGWYPASLCCGDGALYIGNIKGVGSRAIRRDVEKGGNSHDHKGSVQKVALADIQNKETLETWTQQAREGSRIPQILRANVSPVENGGEELLPIPKKLGQPSRFKHVIYVIKENRTFDQVFGDVKEARSEPSLCVFPEEVTPNHHALARRFGLLDNYYCNGVLSADGHSWATEGNVTPYLERAFGGFARSYTFGDDPLTYSSSGFIWDRILAAGLSFRNYGEMNYSEPPKGMDLPAIYKKFKSGEAIQFEGKIGIERLKKYSCLDYPGWNMLIPDVLRMDRFLKEFAEFEKNGGLPNFCVLYLPQDHLGGGVTSQAHMADNDLAVGQLVEAVSKSRFWKETVIFVNEDDPQNGYDHIDGHRSLCLVISPYSKPGVNHSFYNQTSVLRTMLHIHGLAPMNQQDSSMPLMADCFQLAGNFEPYKALPANFELDEVPEDKKKQSAVERKWRSLLATVPIARTGMKTEQDEDNLNRFVWHEMKGWETPYPVAWSGAHGKGLGRLGLVLQPNLDED